MEKGRNFETQINWREKVGLWVVKDVISFSGDKGEDNSGHRIGGLKEMQGAQRPTFPPLLVCLRSWLGLHGCHQNHSTCFLSVAPSLSLSGVWQLFLKLFSVGGKLYTKWPRKWNCITEGILIIVVSMVHMRLNGTSALKGRKLKIKLHVSKEIPFFTIHSSSIFRTLTVPGNVLGIRHKVQS